MSYSTLGNTTATALTLNAPVSGAGAFVPTDSTNSTTGFTFGGGSGGSGIALNPSTITDLPYVTYSQSGQPGSGYYHTTDLSDTSMFPFTGRTLSDPDRAFVTNFKTRHPDFDTYGSEITLILAKKPGLANTVLFMPLIYDLARELKATIDKVFNDDTVEKIVDGQTP